MNDRDFLLNPSGWSSMSDDCGRYCCLKRDDDHAFILTVDNPQGMTGEVLVALGYVFNGGTGEVVSFESVDDVLSQGWVVD